MRNVRYIVVSIFTVLLIVVTSILPVGISAFFDSTTHGKTYISDMDTIQLSFIGTSSELTSVQKLRLVGQGTYTSVADDQVLLTTDNVEQYAVETARRFMFAGLIDIPISELSVSICEPLLYYDFENSDQYFICWSVKLSDASIVVPFEVLIDDSTGKVLYVDYSCGDMSISKSKVELFASCYLDSLNVQYNVIECTQLENGAWQMSVMCFEGLDEVNIELYMDSEGFYSIIS